MGGLLWHQSLIVVGALTKEAGSRTTIAVQRLTLRMRKTLRAAATDAMTLRELPGWPAAMNMHAYCTERQCRSDSDVQWHVHAR